MSKFRVKSVSPIPFLVINENVIDTRLKTEENNLVVLPVDQFSGQPFMKNENGFIMNDIQAFNETQSDGIARAILARTPVFKKDTSEDGLSVDQRLDEIIPSNCCSPAEFSRITKHIATQRYQRELARQEAAIAAQQAALKPKPKRVDVVQPKDE